MKVLQKELDAVENKKEAFIQDFSEVRRPIYLLSTIPFLQIILCHACMELMAYLYIPFHMK